MPFTLSALGSVYHTQQGFAPNNEPAYLHCPHYPTQLMAGLLVVIDEPYLQDVTLECSDGRSVRSSKLFLAACSPFFRKALAQQDSKVQLPGITLEVMEILLSFMSMGNVDVSQRLLLDVIDAATTLQLQGFQKALSQYLARKKHSDIQMEFEDDVLEKDPGNEISQDDDIVIPISHETAKLTKTPVKNSTLISTEQTQTTDRNHTITDPLVETPNLVSSTLGNQLQPTMCKIYLNGLQGTPHSSDDDNIPDSSTNLSFEGFEDTVKEKDSPKQPGVRGHPKKSENLEQPNIVSESSVKPDKTKNGCSEFNNNIDINKEYMGRSRPRQSDISDYVNEPEEIVSPPRKMLKKDKDQPSQSEKQGLARKSENFEQQSMISDSPFQTEYRGRGRPRQSDVSLEAELSEKTEYRGRGRPRQSDISSDTELTDKTEYRGRGRPRQTDISSDTDLSDRTEYRGGRPRQSDISAETEISDKTEYKGRGRPRKSEVSSETESSDKTEYRGRGRPRHSDVSLENELSDKTEYRGRGRPRQSDISSDTELTDKTEYRGRGRPRQSDISSDTELTDKTEYRGRGRPRQSDVSVEVELSDKTEYRGRGRPRHSDVSLDNELSDKTEYRGWGRPRKSDICDISVKNELSDNTEYRGWGRPRKSDISVKDEPSDKTEYKGCGRPRKSDISVKAELSD